MYKWLLFDADNTLMDFDSAARIGLERTLSSQGLTLTDDSFKIFQHVNHECWSAFEKGDLEAEKLRWLRFKKFFDWINIQNVNSVDIGRQYLKELADVNTPYAGVEELLHSMRSNYRMSIITNGLKEVQRPNYRKRGWEELFDSIIVSDEIGVQKPKREYFDYTWKSIEHEFSKKEVLVIGDNLKSDIVGGRDYGLDTCWISSGRKNTTEIYPTYTIESVLELPNILN